MTTTAAPPAPPQPACRRQGIACQCAGVTFAELDETIAADPDADIASLGQALGCGVQCGSCIPALKEALGEVAWFAAIAAAIPITTADTPAGLERRIFRVEITLTEEGAYPLALPGQHVVLRAQVGKELVERTYTVVAQDREARKLTVAIRRTPGGRMTPWLLVPAEPRRIEVSVPGGRALGSQGRKPDVFFAGGVGVTPAMAMARALPAGGTMHLHYSVAHAGDAAFLPEFAACAKARPGFTYSIRDTSIAGALPRRSIRQRIAAYPGAHFYICGPQGYVDFVRRTLQAEGVEDARIHVELFALATTQVARRTFRAKAYVVGALLAVLPLLFLQPHLEELRPHGHPNVGHEKLQCVACHVDTTASTRQTLQAKVKHALGERETGAVFGRQAVTSATCIQCHANPDDRHAPNRFLEPRFEKARAETGAHLCVSCHREHSAARVTVPAPNYCVSCHQDMKVKDDKVSPTHQMLVQNKRWETCLQCHDYHGNHRFSAPLRLQDAATLQVLEKYLKNGRSPYGEPVVKARKEKAS